MEVVRGRGDMQGMKGEVMLCDRVLRGAWM